MRLALNLAGSVAIPSGLVLDIVETALPEDLLRSAARGGPDNADETIAENRRNRPEWTGDRHGGEEWLTK